jgi:hypothetical protein
MRWETTDHERPAVLVRGGAAVLGADAEAGGLRMTYQLIAQIRSTGPARGYPVTIGTFESESECRAAYRQAMREKLDGGYSEDVLDFAIQVPTAASRERTAEADQMDGLLALLGGATDTQPVAQ